MRLLLLETPLGVESRQWCVCGLYRSQRCVELAVDPHRLSRALEGNLERILEGLGLGTARY